MWKKGESSGNLQHVKEIYLDCDLDTILLKVTPRWRVCLFIPAVNLAFFNRVDIDEKPSEIIQDIDYSISDKLYHIINERKLADPKTSYVASLFEKGDNAILKKVVEEAGEFSFAVKDNNEKEIVYEAADLAFHTLVALASQKYKS